MSCAAAAMSARLGTTTMPSPTRPNRRDVLRWGTAAGLSAALPRAASADATGRTLRATTRVIEVNGRPATALGLLDEAGRPGLSLERADGFHVRLTNESGEATIVHWHGLTPPFSMDGNMLSQAPLAPGGVQDFAFDLDRTGTHWMHSHLGLQVGRLMAAPLIVREGPPEMQEVVVILQDFSFAPSEEIMARLRGPGATRIGSGMAAHEMGMMRMQGDMAAMNHGGMAMAGMDAKTGMDHGAVPMDGAAPMDLNDVDFDAFLANDRTLDDPELVRVDAGAPVLLRIVNAATSSNFWIDLGAAGGVLRAVDGMAVAPIRGRRFELAMAQRIDVEVTVPADAVLPILAQREGGLERAGVVLAAPGASVPRVATLAERAAPPVLTALERRLGAADPLPDRPVDRRIACDLTGDMTSYVWGIDGRPFEDRSPLDVAAGERVEITMRNRTMMSHPMHLHGHHFEVVGLGRARLRGARRDTVLVPAMDSVTIAFEADNPGDWPLHCHNLYHREAGMMTTVRYG